MFSSLKGSIPGMPSARTLAAPLLATVLVALPGAVLPGNFQIKQSKIRGQSSES